MVGERGQGGHPLKAGAAAIQPGVSEMVVEPARSEDVVLASFCPCGLEAGPVGLLRRRPKADPHPGRDRAANRSLSRYHSPAKGRNQARPSYGAGTSGNFSFARTGASPPASHAPAWVPSWVISATPVPQQPIA